MDKKWKYALFGGALGCVGGVGIADGQEFLAPTSYNENDVINYYRLFDIPTGAVIGGDFTSATGTGFVDISTDTGYVTFDSQGLTVGMDTTVLYVPGVEAAGAYIFGDIRTQVDDGLPGIGTVTLEATWDFTGVDVNLNPDLEVYNAESGDALFLTDDFGGAGSSGTVQFEVPEGVYLAIIFDDFHPFNAPGSMMSSFSLQIVPAPATAIPLMSFIALASKRRRNT